MEEEVLRPVTEQIETGTLECTEICKLKINRPSVSVQRMYLLLIELIKLTQSVSFQLEKTVTKFNKQKLN